MEVKYFSMFSGVEGFGLGLPKNWECIGLSEIDKYASQVLKYHYPTVKNYGDCTKIQWESIPNFDLLTGGSPCQDFSIAGKRRGLSGSKSSLAWEYIRALRVKKPKYFIWENVKGVLSSRGGWDFANLLTAFSESGYSLWWQVLNAKDFGVPQNRERIFVIGFREGSPKEVFFEREISEKLDEPRNDFWGKISTNDEEHETNISFFDGAILQDGKNRSIYSGIKQLNNPKHSNDRVYGDNGLSPSLNTMQGGNRQPKIKVLSSTQKHSTITEDIAPTLPSAMGLGGGHTPMIFSVNTKKGYAEANEGDGINLCFPNSKTRRGRVIKGNSPTLQTNADGMIGTIQNNQIRKLMPIECERLMSWPDNWTKYGLDEKGNKVEISDSQRYKMCGNGVVSNVVRELVKEILL